MRRALNVPSRFNRRRSLACALSRDPNPRSSGSDVSPAGLSWLATFVGGRHGCGVGFAT